jgi:opacity protein-like surface antigen
MQSHLRSSVASFVFTSVFLLFSVTSVRSQTASSGAHKSKLTSSTDISLGIFGQLTNTRAPMTTYNEPAGTFVTQKTQAMTPSAGVLGTLHQSIKPWLGYNLNVGYTRLTANYSYVEGFIPNSPGPSVRPIDYAQGSIGTNMYELTVAYVFEGPRNRRLRTFGQFGGGGLFFLPTDASPANQQTRPTMVFGVGMEYQLTSHLGIRAEYRGLFYKGPDFAYDSVSLPVQRLFTITNTPAVSLVYRFGGRKRFSNKTNLH